MGKERSQSETHYCVKQSTDITVFFRILSQCSDALYLGRLSFFKAQTNMVLQKWYPKEWEASAEMTHIQHLLFPSDLCFVNELLSKDYQGEWHGCSVRRVQLGEWAPLTEKRGEIHTVGAVEKQAYREMPPSVLVMEVRIINSPNPWMPLAKCSPQPCGSPGVDRAAAGRCLI